jgi:hypothetical protein
MPRSSSRNSVVEWPFLHLFCLSRDAPLPHRFAGRFYPPFVFVAAVCVAAAEGDDAEIRVTLVLQMVMSDGLRVLVC